jgi:predicted RecA/RadA family phage recombinase
MSKSVLGPATGFDIPTKTVELIAHAALVKGDVVGVLTTTVANERLTTTKAAAGAASLASGGEIIVVAMEDIASGAVGTFAYEGIIDVQCVTTGLDVGDYLIADNAATLACIAADVNDMKVVAICLEDNSATGPVKCLFSGFYGIGAAMV